MILIHFFKAFGLRRGRNRELEASLEARLHDINGSGLLSGGTSGDGAGAPRDARGACERGRGVGGGRDRWGMV